MNGKISISKGIVLQPHNEFIGNTSSSSDTVLFNGMSINSVKNTEFDFVIVGGGMVGASLAVSLAKSHGPDCSILLLERTAPETNCLEQIPLRVSAVNRYSEQWLNDIGCWDNIDASSACVFKRLATWEKGSARLEFSAAEIGETHLGHLIRNEALQLASFKSLYSQYSNQVSVLYDTDLTSFSNISETEVDVTLTSLGSDPDETKERVANVKTKLLIGADGANSRVRQLAKIGCSGWDYEQHCFCVTIKTDFETQDITWQEFQPSGPKAFLPLNNGFASLIWYDSRNEIPKLKSMSKEVLKDKIKSVFPSLPGDFDVMLTASFPLTRRQANNYVDSRLVLVGDAAHTINPLAGQGVNLGFKDNAVLTELLNDIDLNDELALTKALNSYQKKRKADSLLMSGVMDSFYHLFSNEKPPLQMLRKGLLGVASQLPLAKKAVMKKALGL